MNQRGIWFISIYLHIDYKVVLINVADPLASIIIEVLLINVVDPLARFGAYERIHVFIASRQIKL